jgi:hypothetical protein
MVRVSDASNPSVNDLSNSAFSIVAPSITVTTPNGGEVWQGLTQHIIYWSYTNVGTSGYVNLEYSTNNGNSWSYIVYGTYNNGYYTWNVPNTVSSTCLIRVSDYYNTSINDVSNSTFSITAASTNISLYSPVGNETYLVGSTQTINWYSQNITNVKLEYSTDGGLTYNTITSSTTNYGYYYWSVPNTVSSTCKIRVSDALNASTQSTTTGLFKIVTPIITVVSPNGGEVITGLGNHTITWNTNSISTYLSIAYSTDNINWNNITTVYNTSGNGSYIWSVPNINSNTVKIKISDYYQSSIYDYSDTTFTINLAPASVQVISPNGGESFAVGSSYYVHWNSTSISNVNI